MATVHDVIEADQRMEEVLTEMHDEHTEDVPNDVYLATKAVCYAIQSVGIRFDYVIREVTKDLRVVLESR